MFTFFLTDLDYLFVHAIFAANWTCNSLVKVDHWQENHPEDVTTGDFTFYNTLKNYSGICICTIMPKNGRVQKGNDSISAEPEMMRWE